MARQTITPQHSTKSNYDNVTIDSGLRADIMRCQMESKNTLTQNGSIYVGVGRADSNGIAYTKELRSGSQHQCLKVINADGDLGYGYLNWNNFNSQLSVNDGGSINLTNGALNVRSTDNHTMPKIEISNLGQLVLKSTGLCMLDNGQIVCSVQKNSANAGSTFHFVYEYTSGHADFFDFGPYEYYNSVTQQDKHGLRIVDEDSLGFIVGVNEIYMNSDCYITSNCHIEQLWIDGSNYSFHANGGTFTDCAAEHFYTLSDQRLKENLSVFSTEKTILDLPIYKFDFIKGSKNQIGCMAQDLQKICPELVQEGPDGYLTIQENKIVFLLLEEVKKLRKEVDELKKEH